MKTKFILGILVLGVLMTSFVSAGLFTNFGAKITGNVVAGSWTEWYDKDNPSGSGDYELLSSLGKVCGDLPITKIDCQTTGGVDFTLTGQKVSCDKNVGFSCGNTNNGGSFITAPCQDYKVRFYCGEISKPTSSCNSEGICTLYEGQSVNPVFNNIVYGAEISYISSTQVKLEIENVVTNVLSEGSTWKLHDGSYLVIKDIQFNSASNGVSSLIFGFQSSTTDTGSTEYYTKSEIDAKLSETRTSILNKISEELSEPEAAKAIQEIAFSKCSFASGFSSAETGNAVCKRYNQTCVLGLSGNILFAEGMAIKTKDGTNRGIAQDNELSYRMYTLSCSQNLNSKSFEGNVLVENDPSWLCC